jgi:hypothetical protein
MMATKKWVSYCKNVLWMLNPFLVVIAWYQEKINFNFYFQWLGKMHPMVLHFPIVLGCMIGGYLFFTNHIKKHITILQIGSIVNAASATIVAILGVFLSKQDTYDTQIIFWHQWGGISIAYLSWLLMYLIESNASFQNHYRFRMSFAIGYLIVIFFFTHKGAQLTHGVRVLSWPENKVTETASIQNIKIDSNATIYERAIGPILQQKCVSCHGPEKIKGNLLLNTPENILKGGKDGNILIAQNGKAALLFERIHLPITDEKHMPPEGKTPLTKEELMILSAWIQAGGNLQLKMNAIAKNDSLFMLANQYQPQIGNPMNNSKRGNGMERSFDDLPNLNEYNSNYCTANYSYHGGRDIEVSFYQSKFYTHDNLIKLKNIKDQITSLSMQNMPLKDEDILFIATLSHLKKLNLNYTSLKINQLGPLQNLKELKTISICGLPYDEIALQKFLQNASFEKVQLWSSNLTREQSNRFIQQFPKIQFTIGDNLENELIKITNPIIQQDSSIIATHLDVAVKHFLKGTNIRYTTDGSDPDSIRSPLFTKPLRFNSNTTLKVKAFKPGWISSDVVQKTFYKSEIHPDTIYFITPPDKKYPGSGAKTLIDYELGEQNFSNGKWIAYRDTTMIFVIGFKQNKKLNEAHFNAFIDNAAYIFPILSIKVEGSNDGKQFSKINEVKFPSLEKGDMTRENKSFSCPITTNNAFKFYRFTLLNLKKLPEWHPGKRTHAWIFVDELFLN